MADNIAVTAGSGTTVSTEEFTTLNGGAVSAQHAQRIIIANRVADGEVQDVNMAASNVARLASSAASTNATNVKTSAGTVDSVKAKNTAAYAVLLIVYDASTNPPVVGTSTIKDIFEFPAGAISAYDFPAGIAMANGIGYALTKSDGTTAVAAGDVTNLSIYYR